MLELERLRNGAEGAGIHHTQMAWRTGVLDIARQSGIGEALVGNLHVFDLAADGNSHPLHAA